MKPLVLFFILVCFAGCSSSEQSTEFTLPELLMQAPLPAFHERVCISRIMLDMKIYVLEDGTVRDVQFLAGSGNTAWDTIAVASIKQWRYSPARYNGRPMKLWFRQKAIVEFSEPTFISLAEIVCNSSEKADSAYASLQHGSDFGEVALQHSIDSSRLKKGILGEVNINLYPGYIKHILARLDAEQCTTPVKFGDQYVIFKRLKN